ncbi:MAG: ABC transporter transmembrane domain-containing protein [Candidatus Binatus sp.]|uniref:ABC transporter ATP-binding protein n=1 Tax=Candidatus Binatus sp. TaxID=2811406 RepID=UPI00271D0B17|nr:ABC transporter transmembrane domain-containing protein [Candidatus Binatus sp.]MDO8432004.1 ABC transporter transmembrane domain-containing protein [Candidatus Binatus sp.]
MKLLSSLQWRLFGYLRRYLVPYALLLGIAIGLLAAASAGIPFIMKLVVDLVTNLRGARTIDPAAAIKLRELSIGLGGLFLMRAAANFADDYLTAYIAQKITMDIRNDLNESLQRQSLSFFNRTPTGVMVSRVINDVNVVVQSLSNGVFSIFADGMSLIALLATAFLLDWRLAIVAFIGFPIVVLPIVGLSKKVRKDTKNAQKQLGGLNALLHETFQGNRVVKAFVMEDYERARFKKELKRLFRINMGVSLIKALTGPMIEALGAIAVVIVVWWAVGSLQSGARTLGQFAGFFTTMILVYKPFKSLSKTNNTIQQGMAAAERVFEMMDHPTEVPDDPAGIELPAGTHRVAFENVSFRYGDEWVLRDINLEIGTGRVIALVGMSGGGKSTLADLIPRFYDVQKGRVTIDGIDLRKLKLMSLRSEIGLVTQHTFLFNDTIRANIAYGSADKKVERVIAAAKLANAHDFISRLPDGYETMVGELGVRLSGGERQRIAIARALLKDPPILILDEATSSLDSEAERSVQEALEHLMENRTTLVIAHRLSTVRRADRIVVIVHGRIVEEGTHDELFARGQEYRKLYDLQFMSPEDLAASAAVAN